MQFRLTCLKSSALSSFLEFDSIPQTTNSLNPGSFVEPHVSPPDKISVFLGRISRESTKEKNQTPLPVVQNFFSKKLVPEKPAGIKNEIEGIEVPVNQKRFWETSGFSSATIEPVVPLGVIGPVA
ncbi:Uncharacterized protein GNX_0766 [Leptospira interrogans serovar Canicola]|nr:Uncharacterized protein GNX_0766 [Leptospira interrogans serovar Canicola]